MRNIIAILTLIFSAICASCVSTQAAPQFTLLDMQGAWWASCEQPAADFVLEGSRLFGDFDGESQANLVNNELFVDDGHGPISYWRLVQVSPNKLTLRPTGEQGPDWVLHKCPRAAENAP
jgi:hypothetical protein